MARRFCLQLMCGVRRFGELIAIVMRAVERKEARGSLKWIRQAVNNHADLINSAISDDLLFQTTCNVEWLSPLEADDYAEYGDQGFLDLLGVTTPTRKLSEFWPNRGPQWDALGRMESGEIVLVEAKANVPEIVSPATAASAESRHLIERSIRETQSFLGVDLSIPWTGRLYQYANRLSHLYFLRELNSVPTFLIFLYFVGDSDVDGPETIAEWKAAITVAKKVLGISERHRMSKYVADVFIDVGAMRGGL